MARIRPFQGVRYCADTAHLRNLLAPPYDIISPTQRERLAKDPHNIVHLELPVDDDGEGSRYEAAARRLRAWSAERVLARDEMPRLYAYRQQFEHGGVQRVRTGFFGLCELVPADGSGGVYPHEFTLAGPREDRLRLLRATHANLSPIFLMHDDPGGRVRAHLEHALTHAPLGEAPTPWGTREALAGIDGLAAGEIADAISGTPLVFADGHHRYESARCEHEERCGAEYEGWVLAVFVARDDPGLLVLPTHRIVRKAGGPVREDIVARAFDVAPLGRPDAVAAERWLAERAREGRTAFVERRAGGESRRLTLRDAARDELFAGSTVDPALRRLDVVVLHALLEHAWGVTPRAIAEEGALSYARSTADALTAVEQGAAAAYLMNPTPIDAVVELARQGHRLPQKTTYFEPKLTSGWVLHVFDQVGATR